MPSDEGWLSKAGLRPWSPALLLRRVVTCGLITAVLCLIGCGSARHADIPAPRRVPRGSVAIVGAIPITATSFDHWLPILYKGRVAAGVATSRALPQPPGYTICVAARRASGARGPGIVLRSVCADEYREAAADTVSFLIRAQALLQESEAEGINASVLNRLVSQRATHASPPAQSGMTAADFAFQVRLDIVAEALQGRHTDVPVSVTSAQVARYYSAHRALFTNPAVRYTRMVVTHTLAAAEQAEAAIRRGDPWATAARRFSVDSSAVNGGAYSVVTGVQPAALERAVFAAHRGRIVGPVRALPAAGPPIPTYYLFEVIGARPRSQQLLIQVATQIKQTVTQELQQRSWAAFARAFVQRWTARTLCARTYVVRGCRNYVARPAGAGTP
jgi:hypothetical protein